MIFESVPALFNAKFEVASCFCEKDGKLLLLLRQDHKPQGNTYGVPAGKLNTGETPLQAIIREVKEEINVPLAEDNLTFVQSVYVRYDEYDFVYHMFKTTLGDEHLKDMVINSDEHKSSVWLSPEEALRLNLIQDEDACIKICYNL